MKRRPVRRAVKVLVGACAATAIVLGGNVGPALAEDGRHQVLNENIRDGQVNSTEHLWFRHDTTVGGGVLLTEEWPGPEGVGDTSLALTTNARTSAKAQLMTAHDVLGTALNTLTAIDYQTFRDSESGPGDATASIQLQVDTNGFETSGGFTTLVFEPSNTPGNDVQDDQWQFWDATNGNWWSTQRIECGTFVVEPGAGGAPFTTLGDVAANCPGAQMILLGLSIGTGAPNLIVGADDLHFQTTEGDFTFDFGPK